MLNAQRIAAGLVTALMAASLAACSGTGGSVATVNGESVSKADFDNKLESSPVAKGVLSQMVQGILLEQYAKDNNIQVTDDEVNKKVDALKTQYGAQFDQLVKQRGMTEDDVRKALRQQLIVDKAVGKDIKVSDSDVNKFFAKNHAAFDKPAQVHARHILVQDLKTAQMIEGKLKSGAKFEDLAKQYSTDPGSKDKGGDLGFFRQGQMVPSFEKAAFSQPVNQVGPPVKSPFGYHIIEVLARTPGTKATVQSAHDQIVDQLKQSQEAPLVQPFLQSLTAKAKIDVKDTRFSDVFPSPAPATATATAAPKQ